jgi:CheY-like chemotaxis protein
MLLPDRPTPEPNQETRNHESDLLKRLALADLLAFFLPEEEYRVMTATNSQETLAQRARTSDPDFLVRAAASPVLDCFGTLRLPQALATNRNIPCIVIGERSTTAADADCDGCSTSAQRPFHFTTRKQFPFVMLPGVNVAALPANCTNCRDERPTRSQDHDTSRVWCGSLR